MKSSHPHRSGRHSTKRLAIWGLVVTFVPIRTAAGVIRPGYRYVRDWRQSEFPSAPQRASFDHGNCVSVAQLKFPSAPQRASFDPF